MEKTMGDMARFLKQLLPVDIPETYSISPMFTDISDEEKIREGVLAFREFLHRLCDGIIDDSSLGDTPRKGKKKFSDETTFTVEFPMMNNLRSILLNIVQYGTLSETGDSFLVNSWDELSLKKSANKNSTTKISVPQMMKGIRFLTTCGINFHGIDLTVKKPNISDIEAIEVTYPDCPAMLVGWKVLGVAQSERATRKNDDIILRCDYRALRDDDTVDIDSRLNDFVYPLPASLQDFVFKFHQYYLDQGMTCNVEAWSLCYHFYYMYKRKVIWRFSSSLHNGFRMILKTKNTSTYAHVTEKFPDYLKEKISKGYGCDRKNGSGHGNCQKGCEGFRFTLDESLLDISQELQLWLDNELASMQRRKKSQKVKN